MIRKAGFELFKRTTCPSVPRLLIFKSLTLNDFSSNKLFLTDLKYFSQVVLRLQKEWTKFIDLFGDKDRILN